MSLSIQNFGNSLYAGDAGNKAFMTPYEKKLYEEKREEMGLPDPLKEFKEHTDPNCECETCKRRKYQDGSNEMVSFKTAQHINPNAAYTAVRAHEQEHVSNAYTKAAQDNGKVIQASVSIHTAICPECGRTYIAGGTTHTQIKYYNEESPYQKALKTQDSTKYKGMNVSLDA